MKIASVRPFLLSCPFPEPLQLPFFGGRRTIVKRDAMFVRVEADNGLVGYGPGAATERAYQAIREIIAPFLADRVLADPDALRVQFLKGPGNDPELAKTYCSVEIALFDLVGKQRGLPVSELVGGRVRDRIRLYGSAGMYLPPEACAAEAAAVAGLGFKAYKMRPALGPEQDLEAVRLARAAGHEVDLMVDAHTWWRMGARSYSLKATEELARGMAEYDITWLEEPLPSGDHTAYRRFKEKDIVPLAGGGHEPNEERCLDLILSQAVDYAQMDFCFQGGYGLGRRLFAAVARAGLKFAFDASRTALEVAAAAHLGVCWPETVVEWLEYPCHSALSGSGTYPFPLAAGILRDPLQIERGNLVVSRAPGLGVAVDESVVDRYPWIPGPWSFVELAGPAGSSAAAKP